MSPYGTGMSADSLTVHGSAVALAGRAVLVLGASGSGKSTLCLALMSIGAVLVADDRVRLRRSGAWVMADAPDTLRGRIEARGVGILSADVAGESPVAVIVDLALAEDQRLPPWRTRDLLGVDVPLVHGHARPHLYAALRQYLLAGRAA